MKLLTCVAFHYRQERLEYLTQILKSHPFLAEEVLTIITTNTNTESEIDLIHKAMPNECPNFSYEISSFPDLDHPWLLPWAHKEIFKEKFQDASFTHFLYTEDDIEINRINIDYWLRAREILRDTGLYPSFLRVEWSLASQCWVSTDILAPLDYTSLRHNMTVMNNCYGFVTLPNPYQGLFFYDRVLMQEHLLSPTFDIEKYGGVETIDSYPNWGGGGVAERANYALTWEKIPDGFISRNAAPYYPRYKIFDSTSFVHHLPNNYANLKPDSPHGKIPIFKAFV